MGYEPAPAPAYVLSANANRSFLADVDVEPTVDLAAIFRDEAPAPHRMTARWIRGAKVPTRIVTTSHAFPLLIHESVIDAFAAAGIGGWRARPVDLFGAREEVIPGYYFLSVLGRCGALAVGNSGEMQFDVTGWDGFDVFVPQGTTSTLVSPLAHQVIDALRERHVRLSPVAFGS